MRVTVARIARAHGIRGDVVLDVRTDEPQRRLAPGAQLFTSPAAVGPLTIESLRDHSGRVLARFDGVLDRSAAERLRGVYLEAEIDPAERPSDPEEFYDHQLVGLGAVDPAGAVLGSVAELVHLPGQDLLVVATPDGREVLVPFVAAIVCEVDVVAGQVVVDAPGGLFEEPGPGSDPESDPESDLESG
jgi:16S rRNA processing protein RimM